MPPVLQLARARRKRSEDAFALRKLTRSDGSAQRGDTNGLESGQVESVFSYAVRCLEINMGEHSLFTSERDDFESDARTTLADFLGIKTAGRSRQLIHDALDQRCLSTPWTTCEQNFVVHVTTCVSGNARKTTRCVRRSLRISICVHNPGICRLFRGAAAA